MRHFALGIGLVLVLATSAAADDAPLQPPEPAAEPPPPPMPPPPQVAAAIPAPPESVAVRVPEPAPAPPPPGITLPAGAVQLAITVETNLSHAAVGSPVSIAPEISYGITKDLTVAIVHSSSQLTGFRGSAGAGVCLGNSCPNVYADGGVEVLGNILRGTFALATEVGVLATNTQPWRTDLKLGLRAKAGKRFFATVSPNVFVAVDARHDPTAPNKDMLYVPAGVGAKLIPQLTTGIGSGVKGPLYALGSTWSVPLGAYAQVALTSKISLGSSFVWGKIAGGTKVADPGTDARAVQVWLSVLDASH